MKLQLKDSGAWRDVGRFDSERQEDVRAASAALMAAMTNQKTVLRIVDDATVQAYCESPFLAWRDL
jgi:hypothetical protein